MREEKTCGCGCGEHLTPDKRGRYATFKNNHDKRYTGSDYTPQDRGHDTPCWIWLRPLGTHDYGVARWKGKQATAHRAYYERFRGDIPDGLEPDHLCRVKACVNPAHLELVTRAENTARGALGKLRAEDVAEIRTSKGPHLDMALKFGISRQYVSALRKGHGWKEVCYQA